jgi:hypothetical protein
MTNAAPQYDECGAIRYIVPHSQRCSPVITFSSLLLLACVFRDQAGLKPVSNIANISCK